LRSGVRPPRARSCGSGNPGGWGLRSVGASRAIPLAVRQRTNPQRERSRGVERRVRWQVRS
jgi:hypothetical protein